MSDETPPHPVPEGHDSRQAYWQAQGMPWRTEPEVDEERQRFLAERRAVTPDIEKGIYPFKDIKLTRADVEWLLTTHESMGRVGAVCWEEEKGKPTELRRDGLDLRGADLPGVNLGGLPLARLRAGWTASLPMRAPLHMRDLDKQEAAAAHFEDADLSEAHLEDASLIRVNLQVANLNRANLEGARLSWAHLQVATFREAHLERTELRTSHLEAADFFYAHLQAADLSGAHMMDTFLSMAHLEGASLSREHLEVANLTGAYLGGADLREALFNSSTRLNRIKLGNQHDGYISVADIRWDAVNLAAVQWWQARRTIFGTRRKAIILGDEHAARQPRLRNGKRKGPATRLDECERAVRANRQLATALRDQGLNDDANRFAYRAQLLHRAVLRRQGQVGAWLVSWFLYVASGYGFRLRRILVSYVVAVAVFAALYYATGKLIGKPKHAYAWYDAVLVSITNIHGRIFTGLFMLGTVQAWLAAAEAVVGLVIEGVFVAMLVQRFFAR